MWSTGTVTISMTERSAGSTFPAHRPPLGLRVVIGLLAFGAALFNVGLMLSDRAPSVMKRIFGDFAVRLSDRLNGSERLGTLADGRTPENDQIVHIGVWAVAMVLVGLAVWRWASLVIAAVVVFAASIFIEVGQGRYSSTRAVERSDVLANGMGVALGVVAAAGCYLAWSAAAGTIAAIRRR